MGDLSLNFSRKEFKCKCGNCSKDTVDHKLVMALQLLRDQLRCRIKIISGNRCHNHNQSVSGSPRSQHLEGKAADIQVDGYTPAQVYDLLNLTYPTQYGIGVYSTFVHFDVRDKKSRWFS